MKIKVYGCRGTISTFRGMVSKYGGNTSCIGVEIPGQAVILDAGSGLVQLDRLTKVFARSDDPIDVLLSHLHLDHLSGLAIFGPIWNPHDLVRIFTCSRDDRPLKEQVFAPFSPPYWPIPMADVVNAQCVEITEDVPFELGEFTVIPFLAAHPDKTISFHITYKDKKLVHLLDNEIALHTEEGYAQLVEFCRDADLVVFDAAYSPVDYPDKRGWGHSTIEEGFILADDCNCKKMLFAHHSFEYSDQELEIMESVATARGEKFIFARDGMEIFL